MRTRRPENSAARLAIPCKRPAAAQGAAQLMHSAQQSPQESKMTKSDHVMRTAAVYAVTLFLVAPPAAQGKELASTPPARSVARKAPRLVL
jgi:hypothetical protein